MKETLDIKPFFRNEHTFPWDYVGLDVPKWGTLHGYLARAVVAFTKDISNPQFMMSNPMLTELERYGMENEEWTVAKIVRYCDERYELTQFERGSVASEVVVFMATYDDFVAFFRKKLQSDLAMGRVSIHSKHFL
jgi:hypothetical protein